MDSIEFGLVEKELNNRINDLKTNLKLYYEIDKHLVKLTIHDYNFLVRYARRTQSEMDKFFTSDLYHLIGMGKLTPYQSYRLCQLVEQYGSFRTDIKNLAYKEQFKGYNGVPEEETKYELSIGISLKTKNKIEI